MEPTIYETDIEVLFREELERRGLRKGIDFAIQFPIRNSFIIDIAFPDRKLAVELDGEAYHPRRTDYFKDYILKKSGWTVVRFWGSEIRDNVKECVNKIME